MNMAFGDLFRSGSTLDDYADGEIDFDPRDVKKYAVRRHAPGQSGARGVPSFDDFDEPISKEAVKRTVEADGLPYGEYKLYALGGEQNHAIGTVWSFKGGEESAVPEEEDLEAKVDALRHELEERRTAEPRIRSPGDAFGALFERVLSGDDLSPEQIENFRTLLLTWVEIEREPTPDHLAAELASIHLERGELAAADTVLGAWFNASGGESQSLIELAQQGDFSDFDGQTVRNLALLQFLDNPRGMVREAGLGLFEASAQTE